MVELLRARGAKAQPQGAREPRQLQPSEGAHHPLLRLQRTIGNRAVGALMQPQPFLHHRRGAEQIALPSAREAELASERPAAVPAYRRSGAYASGDPLEQEAERAAESAIYIGLADCAHAGAGPTGAAGPKPRGRPQPYRRRCATRARLALPAARRAGAPRPGAALRPRLLRRPPACRAGSGGASCWRTRRAGFHHRQPDRVRRRAIRTRAQHRPPPHRPRARHVAQQSEGRAAGQIQAAPGHRRTGAPKKRPQPRRFWVKINREMTADELLHEFVRQYYNENDEKEI